MGRLSTIKAMSSTRLLTGSLVFLTLAHLSAGELDSDLGGKYLFFFFPEILPFL
jgi:hypothetical protein